MNWLNDQQRDVRIGDHIISSSFDDQEISSSNIGDGSVFLMIAPENTSSSYNANNKNNVDAIELMKKVVSGQQQHQSGTDRQQRKVVMIDEMTKRITEFRQQIRVAINRSFDCDIITHNDNERSDEAMAKYLYAFVVSTAAADKIPNNEPTLGSTMDNHLQWEKKKKKKSDGNGTHDGTDTDDADTYATEIIVFDVFSDEEESSNDYSDYCFSENDEEEQHYFVDDDDDGDDGDGDDDDYDDYDFITKKAVGDDDDRGNDSSISMIDNLIDQFEFDLLELQNDISSHFDSFSEIMPCQQEQEQEQEHHYVHQHQQCHPCTRRMTIEECEGILPVQQPLRIDNKGDHNNNNNVIEVSTMQFDIEKNDDDSVSTQQIIIPYTNTSAFGKYLFYSKFFIHQKWCIL